MHTTLTRLLPLLTAGALTACAAGDKPGTDDTDTVDTVDTDTVDTDSPADTDVTDTDPAVPAKPVLGDQIDRVGRPGITTALLGAFGTNSSTGGMLRDGYNTDANTAGWTSSYKSGLMNALAVWDGLDTQCGNQLLAVMPGTVITYNNLGGVLADDKLYVNAAGAACTTFLAVELNASGQANMDCGGRTLDEDTTDALYSLLITGTMASVDDGISVPASSGVFPYLAAPN